jgi:hypothetical protein
MGNKPVKSSEAPSAIQFENQVEEGQVLEGLSSSSEVDVSNVVVRSIDSFKLLCVGDSLTAGLLFFEMCPILPRILELGNCVHAIRGSHRISILWETGG